MVLVVQADAAGDAELGAVAAKFEAADLGDMAVQVDFDGAVVLQLVVEERQVEIFDARLDDQLVDVGQLAGTRTVPPATALVNGESRGSKKRT